MRNEGTHRRRARLPECAAALACLALIFAPARAGAQVSQLLRAISDGGSWIRLPVEKGRAEYRSPVLPVAGLTVRGCVKIWDGNPGSWTLRARDLLGDAELDVTTESQEPVKFDYQGGFRAQLDVVVEWSEPGDTTLYLWIGVSRPEEEDAGERDICQPPPS